MHLLSRQTPDAAWLRDEGTGLLEHCADVICSASGHLLGLSVRHLAVDAYFAKRPFVDMVLRYRYTGPSA